MTQVKLLVNGTLVLTMRHQRNGMKLTENLSQTRGVSTRMSLVTPINPVAKHARKFNRSAVMIDRKKESKKNPPKEKIDQYI